MHPLTSATKSFCCAWPPGSAGWCTAWACLLEATAPKPGNVSPGRDFADLTYADLLTAGQAIAPVVQAAADGLAVGPAILQAVNATRQAVGTNANLGIILLLVPLAKVPPEGLEPPALRAMLESLSAAEARQVYQAIRAAAPGGMGTSPQADIRQNPPDRLLDAMTLAAGRDMVARQWVGGFRDVLHEVVPQLQRRLQRGTLLIEAIVQTHVAMLARWPDSLIARKCGPQIADEAASRAALVDATPPDDPAYPQRLQALDDWLRADGHRRNPGTTADLIAAGLFVLLRRGELDPAEHAGHLAPVLDQPPRENHAP